MEKQSKARINTNRLLLRCIFSHLISCAGKRQSTETENTPSAALQGLMLCLWCWFHQKFDFTLVQLTHLFLFMAYILFLSIYFFISSHSWSHTRVWKWTQKWSFKNEIRLKQIGLDNSVLICIFHCFRCGKRHRCSPEFISSVTKSWETSSSGSGKKWWRRCWDRTICSTISHSRFGECF